MKAYKLEVWEKNKRFFYWYFTTRKEAVAYYNKLFAGRDLKSERYLAFHILEDDSCEAQRYLLAHKVVQEIIEEEMLETWLESIGIK